MSVSRGLSLLRLARAAPRALSLARHSCRMQRPLSLSTLTHTYPSPRQRFLSSQTHSDPPGSSSTSHLDSDPLSAEKSEIEEIEEAAEIEVTSGTDDLHSDPELTSDSSDSDSDPELTSDSSDSDSDPELTSDLDERGVVLEAAMDHVASMGWTPVALEEGARDMGLGHAVEDMFPRGGGELVDYFEIQCNSDLVDFLKQRVDEDDVKGSDLLLEAMEHRLRMIVPYINNWPQAMALKAFPTNAPTALENLALMVDDMWYHAGDRSTDFGWYTKRGLLATIYCSAEVFLVQDTSTDFQETWKFLHRRMEDANAFGKASKEFQGLVCGGVETLSAGLNTALNALGMRSR